MLAVDLRSERADDGGGRKKLIGWIEWVEVYVPTCPACQDIYANRKPPGIPPCDTCRVMLDEVNVEAAKVYQVSKRQVRVAPASGQIIDLDYAAVKAVMDVYGVSDQRACFDKVIRVFHHFLSERNRGE